MKAVFVPGPRGPYAPCIQVPYRRTWRKAVAASKWTQTERPAAFEYWDVKFAVPLRNSAKIQHLESGERIAACPAHLIPVVLQSWSAGDEVQLFLPGDFVSSEEVHNLRQLGFEPLTWFRRQYKTDYKRVPVSAQVGLWFAEPSDLKTLAAWRSALRALANHDADAVRAAAETLNIDLIRSLRSAAAADRAIHGYPGRVPWLNPDDCDFVESL
ncbi:MAG: hypothetical protein D6800_08685 [Candidatus Zixiibacteriota bacterium]|nr:MAG: hypothetical protein D6800_08685 [candidate division Zixibacteria bacterium]